MYSFTVVALAVAALVAPSFAAPVSTYEPTSGALSLSTAAGVAPFSGHVVDGLLQHFGR